MSLTKEGYKARLIDDRIARYLRIFGAVLIEGPMRMKKAVSNIAKDRLSDVISRQ
jgi:hypothetical protein